MLNTRIGSDYNANDVINSNDLRKRIINVDSRFRADKNQPTTDFTYKVEHPYKNLIRLRVASVEIPNMYYNFTKKNNCMTLKAFDINGLVKKVTIQIEEGNYTSVELIDAIQTELDTKVRDPYGIYLQISINTITAKITITNRGTSATPIPSINPQPTQSAKPFIIDFVCCSAQNRTGCSTDMKITQTLGKNLGYKSNCYKVTNTKEVIINNNTLTQFYQTAESVLDVVGNTYMFLSLNDLHTVEQKTDETYIQCLAKIIIREDKHTVIYDDGSSLLSNEIIFTSPTDLKILQVKLLDPYGNVIDLNGLNFSFSLEITEVQNTKLYDFYRNYIWLGTIPSVNYKTVTGSPQPLLRGIGPPW